MARFALAFSFRGLFYWITYRFLFIVSFLSWLLLFSPCVISPLCCYRPPSLSDLSLPLISPSTTSSTSLPWFLGLCWYVLLNPTLFIVSPVCNFTVCKAVGANCRGALCMGKTGISAQVGGCVARISAIDVELRVKSHVLIEQIHMMHLIWIQTPHKVWVKDY